jgi:putative transposase
VILARIRWYVAYPLSYRHIEELMEERGVSVNHSTINRWAVRFLPLIEKLSRKHKRKVGCSWRMDETYIKVKGIWQYFYRAVDKKGKTVDWHSPMTTDTFDRYHVTIGGFSWHVNEGRFLKSSSVRL